MEIVIIVLVALVLFVLTGLGIRALARIPRYWTFVAANGFALVTSEEDGSGDGMTGAGNIVDILHAVPGMILIKTSRDVMDWELKELSEDEEDPDHQNFFYKKLGVQSMGNIYFTTRLCTDTRARFTRTKKTEGENKPGEVRVTSTESLGTVTKVVHTRNVMYSGELTVPITEADTSDKLGINLAIDLTFRRRFPARSVLRIADPAAYITSLVEHLVNDTTVQYESNDYIGGKGTQERRREIVSLLEKTDGNPIGTAFREKILQEIGLEIKTVSLREIKMKEAHRLLLEKYKDADENAKAEIRRSEGERDAKKNRNQGDADYVQTVILPIAKEGEAGVRIREAVAYETNKTVTTYAPGQKPVLPLK